MNGIDLDGDEAKLFSNEVNYAPIKTPFYLYKNKPFEIIKLTETIGKGSFGHVYRGLIGNKEVAIKHVIPTMYECSERVQRKYQSWNANKLKLKRSEVKEKSILPLAFDKIIYELQLLKIIGQYRFIIDTLRTPCFWREYGVFMPMELCLGNAESLLHLMKEERKISLEVSLLILFPILMALAHMHSLGIAHLDLKPQNILISKDFIPKLCDFGSSRALPVMKELQVGSKADLSSEYFHVQTKRLGTKGFRAPEYLHEKKEFGLNADVWSFGVILMLFYRGKKELKGGEEVPHVKEALETWRQRQFERMNDRDRDEEVERIIRNMIEFDHTKRFHSPQVGSNEYIVTKMEQWKYSTCPPVLREEISKIMHKKEMTSKERKISFVAKFKKVLFEFFSINTGNRMKI